MTGLVFAKDLSLPRDVITQKVALLGRSGSGKSYAARRIIESMLRIGAQVVVIDPVGTWHGLRLGSEPIAVPILGGLHGDIPLLSDGGVAVADVVSTGVSMVLDVSQMHDAERTRFVTAFIKRLFEKLKAAPRAMMLVLEECQEMVPQNPQGGEEHMLSEFVRYAKIARNFGGGLMLISQRPQEINKKALNQAECVMAFQMTGPHERKALEYWLSDRGLNDPSAPAPLSLSKVLPTLEIGKPLVWSPSWLKISRVVEVLPITTGDTSQTPEIGGFVRGHEMTLRPIDLGALQGQMRSAVEHAKDNDPKRLREEVTKLRARVQELEEGAPAAFDEKAFERLNRTLEECIEGLGQVLEDEAHSLNTALAEQTENLSEGIAQLSSRFRQAVAQWRNTPAPAATKTKSQRASAPKAATPEPARIPRQPTKTHAPKTELPAKPSRLPKADLVLLRVIKQFGSMSLKRAAIIAGYPPSASTTKNAAGRLRTAGLLNGSNDRLDITDAGTQEAGDVGKYPHTAKDRLAYWTGRLPACDARLLQAVAASKDGITFKEACKVTGYDPDRSTAKNAMGRIRSLGLVQGSNAAGVSLAPELQ